MLDLPKETGDLLERLVASEKEDDFLTAYQIGFDLVDNESQAYTGKVIDHLVTKKEACARKERLERLLTILKGEVVERLNLQFLKKNNHTDMLLINKMKDDLGKAQKQSVPHNAIFWSNGMMNAYTTNDSFLRDNLPWAESATNWNRFMVIASLGMIHSGNRAGAEELLAPYFAG